MPSVLLYSLSFLTVCYLDHKMKFKCIYIKWMCIYTSWYYNGRSETESVYLFHPESEGALPGVFFL